MSDNVVRICDRCGDVLSMSPKSRHYQIHFGTWVDRDPSQAPQSENRQAERTEVCGKCYGEVRKSFQGEVAFRHRLGEAFL